MKRHFGRIILLHSREHNKSYIIRLQQLIFYQRYVTGNLPEYYSRVDVRENENVHTHYTEINMTDMLKEQMLNLPGNQPVLVLLM